MSKLLPKCRGVSSRHDEFSSGPLSPKKLIPQRRLRFVVNLGKLPPSGS